MLGQDRQPKDHNTEKTDGRAEIQESITELDILE